MKTEVTKGWFLGLLLLLAPGCGTEVGNPGDDDDEVTEYRTESTGTEETADPLAEQTPEEVLAKSSAVPKPSAAPFADERAASEEAADDSDRSERSTVATDDAEGACQFTLELSEGENALAETLTFTVDPDLEISEIAVIGDDGEELPVDETPGPGIWDLAVYSGDDLLCEGTLTIAPGDQHREHRVTIAAADTP